MGERMAVGREWWAAALVTFVTSATLVAGVRWATAPAPPPRPPAGNGAPSALPVPRAATIGELRSWAHRLAGGRPLDAPVLEDGRHWITRMLDLARATRAPVPSLNDLERSLAGDRGAGARRKSLELLAQHAGSELTPLLARARRDLETGPPASCEEWWALLEAAGTHELLAVLLSLEGLSPALLGTGWEPSLLAIPVFFDGREEKNWLQIRTYLYTGGHAGGGRDTTLFGVVDAARQTDAVLEETDRLTGGARLPDRHGVTVSESVSLWPTMIGPPGVERLEFLLKPTEGADRTLSPRDLLWVSLPGRRPVLMHGSRLEQTGSGGAALAMIARAFPGDTWRNSPLMVKITREHIPPAEGRADDGATLYLGWIRAVAR